MRITQAHFLNNEQLTFFLWFYLFFFRLLQIHSVNTIPGKNTKVQIVSTLGVQYSRKHIKFIGV